MKSILLSLLFVAVGFAQVKPDPYTVYQYTRVDTSTSSTSWKGCYVGTRIHTGSGQVDGYNLVPLNQAGWVRFAFNYADTVSTGVRGLYKGGIIPYTSSVNRQMNLPRVWITTDTVWVKADSGTIYFHYKF